MKFSLFSSFVTINLQSTLESEMVNHRDLTFTCNKTPICNVDDEVVYKSAIICIATCVFTSNSFEEIIFM